MSTPAETPPADPADEGIRPAATVMLLRETPERGLETLMLRRGAAAFAAHVWVFPGGMVDAADRDPELAARAVGLSPAEAHARLGGAERRGPLTPADSFGVHVAAVRELLEEVTVGLFYGPDGNFVNLDDPATAERWEAYRVAVLAGTTRLADVLRLEEARLAFDRLVYYSHWITPKVSPRRYNTHFFIATMPENQRHRHEPEEALESEWVRPADALARHERGDFPLIAVTRHHLRRLADYGTIAAAVAHARTKPIPPVEPIAERAGGKFVRERLTPEVAECW